MANLCLILVSALSFSSNVLKCIKKNNKLKSVLSPAPTYEKVKYISNKETKV